MCRAQTIHMERDPKGVRAHAGFARGEDRQGVVRNRRRRGDERGGRDKHELGDVQRVARHRQGVSRRSREPGRPDPGASRDAPAIRRDAQAQRRGAKKKRERETSDAKNRKKLTDAFSKARSKRPAGEESRDDRAPKKMTQREIPRPPIGSGRLETFVSSDFARRAIGGRHGGGDADVTDVLVYFAFPRRNPGKHAATMDTLRHVSEAVALAARSKPRVGQWGKDNRARTRGARGPEIPRRRDAHRRRRHRRRRAQRDPASVGRLHRWARADSVSRAREGKAPSFAVPGRGTRAGSGPAERRAHPRGRAGAAPASGGRPETRESAGVAFARMDQRILEGGGRDRFADEHDEL